MDQDQKLKKNQPKLKNSLNSYAHYSGVAFEMIAVMLGGVFLGIKLDDLTKLKPLFTLFFSLAGFALALWLIIREVQKN